MNSTLLFTTNSLDLPDSSTSLCVFTGYFPETTVTAGDVINIEVWAENLTDTDIVNAGL